MIVTLRANTSSARIPTIAQWVEICYNIDMEQKQPLNEIFALLRQGNKSGLELLYDFHYNKMYGIAFSVLKNKSMAEDVVHNVTYKFMSMDKNLFPTANEDTWLYSVVKNEALMLLRKEKRIVPIKEIRGICLEDKNIEEFVDLNDFNSMIQSLNDKQKTVVWLKILGGYTHKEIAKMLDMPIGTVQWIYNTSIKRIRRILTSLLTVICVLFTGLIASIYLLFNYEDYLSKDIQASNVLSILIAIVSILCIAIVAILAIFIYIYKKSDKLPTKTSI